MKKISTLFKKDPNDLGRVINEVDPQNQWVIDGKEYFPKGFYYQGKFIILVGCEKSNHTIRRKERISDVEITVTKT
jgi:hypothetical protein